MFNIEKLEKAIEQLTLSLSTVDESLVDLSKDILNLNESVDTLVKEMRSKNG